MRVPDNLEEEASPALSRARKEVVLPPSAASLTPRIGYVLKVFPRVSETFVINEIRALEKLRTELGIFSLHPPQHEVLHRILRDLHHPIRYVDATPAPSDEVVKQVSKLLQRRMSVEPQRRAALLPRKYVRLAILLADLVRRESVGHLHAHFASRAGHVAALTAALTGCSYSITAHAKDLYHRDVNPHVLRWKLSRARLVVTVTDYNLRHLENVLAETAGGQPNLIRIYNGVDLERFRAVPFPRSTSPRILGVGRLVEKKGFAFLVEACRILRNRGRDFTCEIIGGGPEEESLRERIATYGLSSVVSLRGVLTTEQVEKRLREASVVALPCVVGSDSNVDALPTVLLEAMATARPVVSTRLSGIPEIVTDQTTGLLVPPADAGALADALQHLLERPDHAAAMGRAAREKAELCFDLQTNAAQLRRVLLEPTEGGKSSG